jgi:hypothetical protein
MVVGKFGNAMGKNPFIIYKKIVLASLDNIYNTDYPEFAQHMVNPNIKTMQQLYSALYPQKKI